MKGFSKTVLIILGVVVSLFIVICIISILFAKSKQISFGKTAIIKQENIEITVLSSETTTIEDPTGIAIESGDFIKVKVRIKNNDSEPYTWNNLMTFKLGDKYVSTIQHSDDLPNTIESGKVEEGYLYFEYTDEIVMDYFTSFTADSSDNASASKYMFRIK